MSTALILVCGVNFGSRSNFFQNGYPIDTSTFILKILPALQWHLCQSIHTCVWLLHFFEQIQSSGKLRSMEWFGKCVCKSCVCVFVCALVLVPLRYNLHMTKSTDIRYTVMDFSNCIQLYNLHQIQDIEKFCHSEKFLHALSQSTVSRLPATGNHWSAFYHHNFVFSRISYKHVHTIWSYTRLLSIAYMYLRFIPAMCVLLFGVFLYCWVVFHNMNMPHFA